MLFSFGPASMNVNASPQSVCQMPSSSSVHRHSFFAPAASASLIFVIAMPPLWCRETSTPLRWLLRWWQMSPGYSGATRWLPPPQTDHQRALYPHTAVLAPSVCRVLFSPCLRCYRTEYRETNGQG